MTNFPLSENPGSPAAPKALQSRNLLPALVEIGKKQAKNSEKHISFRNPRDTLRKSSKSVQKPRESSNPRTRKTLSATLIALLAHVDLCIAGQTMQFCYRSCHIITNKFTVTAQPMTVKSSHTSSHALSWLKLTHTNKVPVTQHTGAAATAATAVPGGPPPKAKAVKTIRTHAFVRIQKGYQARHSFSFGTKANAQGRIKASRTRIRR